VALGIFALAAYNELLQGGEALVAAGKAEPALVLWLPWVVVSLVSLGSFVYLVRWPSIRLPSRRPSVLAMLSRDVP
jgi:hypothetical protein